MAATLSSSAPSPVDASTNASSTTLAVSEAPSSVSTESSTQQRNSNYTAPKKQRKGPKGGTMKPPKDVQQAQQAKKAHQQPKQPKQKGPKNNKAKPSPYQFYYQELAADLTRQAPSVQTATPLSPVRENRESIDVKAFSSAPRITPVFTETETTTTVTTTTTVKKERKLALQVNERPRTSSNDSLSGSSEHTLNALPTVKPKKSQRSIRPAATQHTVVTLDDVDAVAALESLLERHGGVQHGGILDSNYSFFVTRSRSAAISFIVKDKIAVVGGDPLCEPYLFDAVIAEFKEYRKRHGLGVAIFGGGRDLLDYGKQRGWSSIRFGTERVLNPMDNPVLQEKVQKQIIRQNKQLLDPEKYGLSLGVYDPSSKVDSLLQSQLVGVYEAWREAKNASGRPQSYTTIYDPFALPNLMIYIYTKDKEGVPNGFAALRKMGSRKGYYIDPCIAAPGAPRRITDLLYFTAMAMLNTLGCGYLSIGMEPSAELEIAGFGNTVERLARKVHERMFDGLKLGGKAEYYSKFRPDANLDQGMYIMFPKGMPSARQLLATMHFANISIRAVMRKQLDQKLSSWQADREEEQAEHKSEDKDSDDKHSEGSDGAPSRPQTSAAPLGTNTEARSSRPNLGRLRSKLSLQSLRSLPDLKARPATAVSNTHA